MLRFRKKYTILKSYVLPFFIHGELSCTDTDILFKDKWGEGSTPPLAQFQLELTRAPSEPLKDKLA